MVTLADLITIIKSTNGKVFRATFIKRSTGELRHLVGRLGVTKDQKGVGLKYDPATKNLLTVYDFQKRGYRMINLDGLKEVVFQGKTYTRED